LIFVLIQAVEGALSLWGLDNIVIFRCKRN
jgi:hypothetical protein